MNTNPLPRLAVQRAIAVIVAVACLAGSCLLAAAPAQQETYHSQKVDLAAYESQQLKVAFADAPARVWTLKVDGGDTHVDVIVERVRAGTILYDMPYLSQHEVRVPWGTDEELLIVLTAGESGASATVSYSGPPRSAEIAVFSYGVNRAIEAYSIGQKQEAASLAQKALKDDPGDDEARVVLAQYLFDQQHYERAEAQIERALRNHDLSPTMEEHAQHLKTELSKHLAAAPKDVKNQLEKAESALDDGDAQKAFDIVQEIYVNFDEYDAGVKAQILTIRGRAQVELSHPLVAIDDYVQAVNYAGARSQQALIYFYTAQAYEALGDEGRAKGAYLSARHYGLPAGLDAEAVDALAVIGSTTKWGN